MERTKQDFGNAVTFSAPFTDLTGSYSAPFRDNEYVGKLDWNIRPSMHMFYKFGYNNNSVLKPGNDYSPFINRDNTPSHTVGLDFTTGHVTHSIRYGYNWLGLAPAGKPVKLSEVRDPADTVAFAESTSCRATPLIFSSSAALRSNIATSGST